MLHNLSVMITCFQQQLDCSNLVILCSCESEDGKEGERMRGGGRREGEKREEGGRNSEGKEEGGGSKEGEKREGGGREESIVAASNLTLKEN